MNASSRRGPPAGGFGSGPSSGEFGPAETAAPARSQSTLRALVTVLLVLATFGSVIVLVVTGCHRYIANAKTAEARHNLAEISANAVITYETRERRMCPSASQPVPADPRAIAARPYQSSRLDYKRDEAIDAGFSCLAWETTAPQYFQYAYFATPTSFVARARGDLNGDGVLSDFVWTGDVKDGHVVVSPRAYEHDIEE